MPHWMTTEQQLTEGWGMIQWENDTGRGSFLWGKELGLLEQVPMQWDLKEGDELAGRRRKNQAEKYEWKYWNERSRVTRWIERAEQPKQKWGGSLYTWHWPMLLVSPVSHEKEQGRWPCHCLTQECWGGGDNYSAGGALFERVAEKLHRHLELRRYHVILTCHLCDGAGKGPKDGKHSFWRWPVIIIIMITIWHFSLLPLK
jgi:hypothetical protein